MKLKSLGTALTTAALIGTALTGVVATAGTAAAANPPQDCSRSIVNVPAKETVNVRTSPKTTATAIGIWGKGKKGGLCNDGKAYKGGSYKACGKTSNMWLYGGDKKTGWVPATCIKW
ncbi:hypothetical protein AQI95_07875 [Streptomyces yokosukanensis]|uniref:SH3b domain-containing protein n=1 Tax=Streptomyces yokosukanensis TaxID=67386 RepID=A0A101PBB0_9ACTN|nr:hypothetical protein [Streptomyces yokosukanensis]KUN08299.1 hypothetical protein AQI95_07875 [Streptomyces yokosukanensis]